tara:strand:- start:939 stop:1595 length:657 start_codon:yes stop_codon:yes gene_type:complete
MDNELDYTTFYDKKAKSQTKDFLKANWSSEKSMQSRFKVLSKVVKKIDNTKVLDIGCGPGNLETYLRSKYKNLEMTGVDTSESMLSSAKSNNPKIKFMIGNIVDLPFKKNSFDLTVSLGVLQNFDGDIDKAIHEICRVTRKSGHIFVTTIDSEYAGYKDGSLPINNFYKTYNPTNLSKIFENNNVEIIDMKSFSTETSEILPLHQWNKFFIYGKKLIS